MGRMNWMPETTSAAAWLIFLATYAVVALGKIPVYRIDRAGAALLGGSLMVATFFVFFERQADAPPIQVDACLRDKPIRAEFDPAWYATSGRTQLLVGRPKFRLHKGAKA